MKKLLWLTLVGVVTLALLAASIPVAAQQAPEMNAAEILTAVYDAVEANDLDAAVDLLADDFVLTLIPAPRDTNGVFIGKDAARSWYEVLAGGHGRFEISDVTVVGNRAVAKLLFWDEHFEEMGVAPAEYEGVSIAHHGKLKSLTWVESEAFAARRDAARKLAGNKDFVLRYFAALNVDKSPATVDEYMTDEVLKEHIVMFERAFPGYQLEAKEMIAEGDQVFVLATFTGIHNGDLMGIAPTGKSVEIDIALTYHIVDGKIADHYMLADLLTLMQQVGVVPTQ